jgi:hypothetical protein
MVITRIILPHRARHGECRSNDPALEAEYAHWPTCPSKAATEGVDDHAASPSCLACLRDVPLPVSHAKRANKIDLMT